MRPTDRSDFDAATTQRIREMEPEELPERGDSHAERLNASCLPRLRRALAVESGPAGQRRAQAIIRAEVGPPLKRRRATAEGAQLREVS